MSLASSIIDIVKEYAETHGFTRVNSLKLSVGSMSHVSPSSLRFAFEVLSEGTIAHGADLEFTVSPVKIYCFSCEEEFIQELFLPACPSCGGDQVMLTGGTEELQLLEMDVDGG
ncbi:MAG: hydrogenase maturation nickel metallochaperone HypA [Desulfomonilia bacterium]